MTQTTLPTSNKRLSMNKKMLMKQGSLPEEYGRISKFGMQAVEESSMSETFSGGEEGPDDRRVILQPIPIAKGGDSSNFTTVEEDAHRGNSEKTTKRLNLNEINESAGDLTIANKLSDEEKFVTQQLRPNTTAVRRR